MCLLIENFKTGNDDDPLCKECNLKMPVFGNDLFGSKHRCVCCNEEITIG